MLSISAQPVQWTAQNLCLETNLLISYPVMENTFEGRKDYDHTYK